MKIRYNETVSHSVIPKNPKPYVVHCTRGCLGFTFIVMADDADKAIEALRANAFAVISKVRSEMKPEDFEKHQLFRSASTKECQAAAALENEITLLQDKLNDNEDRTDEMAELMRGNMSEHIQENFAKIKELRADKPTGTSESKFEQSVSRMTELLGMTYKAEPLDTMRAYPVSYFDDERSVLNWVG